MTVPVLDIHQILKKLPHRYPILLVDRVVELEKHVRIKALKNVTINEPFFMGHFPHRPVMPGVLMLEALAQTAALLSFESAGTEPGVYSGPHPFEDNASWQKNAATLRQLHTLRERIRALEKK